MDDDDERILRALYDARGPQERQIVEELAARVDHKILEYGGRISDSLLRLLTNVFSDRVLLEKRGIIRFFDLILCIPWYLSGAQKTIIINTFVQNYHKYPKVVMYWIICDFIAREYETDESIRIFGSLFENTSEKGRKGLRLGLDILSWRADERQLDEIVSIWKSA